MCSTIIDEKPCTRVAPIIPHVVPNQIITRTGKTIDVIPFPPDVAKSKKDAYENSEVLKCEIAAIAKGISVSEELKSLVIEIEIKTETEKRKEKDFWMVHLPGDKRFSYEAVRKILSGYLSKEKSQLVLVKKVQLISKKILLEKFDALPGTTNPFTNDKLAKLPQLVAKELFFKKIISTNAGELDSFIYFTPKLLHSELSLISKNVLVESITERK